MQRVGARRLASVCPVWDAGNHEPGHLVISELVSTGTCPAGMSSVRSKAFVHEQIGGLLPLNANVREVHLVAFILYGFLGSRSKSLLTCIPRCIAMTANHLFADFDSNQPLRVGRIPRDCHMIRTHGFLHSQSTPHCSAERRFGETYGLDGALPSGTRPAEYVPK
jgi:hypothetical protein